MNDLAKEIATAQTHAIACFNVLNKHCSGATRCGCRVESVEGFPVYATSPSCLPGLNAGEEYDIAKARVLELKAKSTTPR